MRLPMRCHQRHAVDRTCDIGYRALWLIEPGLGKTRANIELFTRARLDRVARRLLVTAPLWACRRTWREELERWAPALRVGVAAGEKPAMREQLLWDESLDVIVMNHDNVQWLAQQMADRRRIGFDAIVVDESHRMKLSTGPRMKALRSILHPTRSGGFKKLMQFKMVVAQSGTPAPKDLHDLYGQALLVDGGNALGHNLTAFRNRWCSYRITSEHGGEFYVPEHRDQELYEALRPISVSVRLSDADVDLPPLTTRDVYVQLPAEVQRTYRQFKRNAVSLVNGVQWTLKGASSEIGRAHV